MAEAKTSKPRLRPDGSPLQGPHWTPLQEIDARELGSNTQDSLDELISDVAVTTVPMAMRVDIHSSGQNVALRRWPAIEIEPHYEFQTIQSIMLFICFLFHMKKENKDENVHPISVYLRYMIRQINKVDKIYF